MSGKADPFDWRWMASAALGSALVLAPAGARGGQWTNAAGHAVEAELLSVDGGSASFQRPDGSRFAMPLASLAPESRRQAVAASGRIPVPDRLQTDFGLCVRTLKRLDALRQAGGLGDDDYEARRNAALARLKSALARLDVPESERFRLLVLARNQ